MLEASTVEEAIDWDQFRVPEIVVPRILNNLFQSFMKPKILYIFLIGFLCSFGIFLFFFLRGRLQPPPSIKTEQAIKNAIENSEVRDEKGDPVHSAGGEYLLVEATLETRYQIIYQGNTGYFLISIHSQPFEEVRRKAEEKLLQLTKTNQKGACDTLRVKVFAAPSLDSGLRDKIFPLSFCQ